MKDYSKSYRERESKLPQILLMENVPQVISKTNINDFIERQRFLEKLGYKNYCEILNSKDYGIPQNRERCFMVSLLGEYSYTFPEKQTLKLRLKDMLEEKVDEKYFLSEEQIKSIEFSNYMQNKNRIQEKDICETLCARDFRGPKCIRVGDKPICLNSKDENGVQPSVQNRIYDTNGTSTAITTAFMPSINDKLRVRKLTPKECWRLMGFEDKDFERAKEALNQTFFKGKDKSNSALYKQAGNSIVINVLEAIFKQLF